MARKTNADTKKPLELHQFPKFDVDPRYGFLPSRDPLTRLPDSFAPWEELGAQLPKLLAAGTLRRALRMLPVLDTTRLHGAENHRAMLLLSFFGHGYVWENWKEKPDTVIPKGVAIPWFRVAERLGRPPVLSYASYALSNWRRIDQKGEIALGNIALLQNFLGGIDEEWFILVHVDIEAKAGRAITAIPAAQNAVVDGNVDQLERHLITIAYALRRMHRTLLRMPEHCDPYIYYNRVRPYIHGWKDHPAIPEGVIYEGVDAFLGKPQVFRGETGAQSSIIPSLDAALGITHSDDPLRVYLEEMRIYMPKGHRLFLRAIERGPSVRHYVLKHCKSHRGLRDSYNECIQQLALFRAKHFEYAITYIQMQTQKSLYNPTATGTGGTPFLDYLKKHRDETLKHLIY